MCRPCIREDDISYGIDRWVEKLPVTGMACEFGAVIEAAACAGDDT